MASAIPASRSSAHYSITPQTAYDRAEPRLIDGAAAAYQAPPPLTADEATSKLRKEEFTCQPKSLKGVRRYDVVRVASNSPSEDDFTHAVLNDPVDSGSDWLAWAIFDGHISWDMAAHLRESLLPAVAQSLRSKAAPGAEKPVPSVVQSLKRKAPSGTETPISSSVIDESIKHAFVELDRMIIEDAAAALKTDLPLSQMLPRISLGSSGSCALLSLYDPEGCVLRVACVGDSRAVLGRRSSDDKWKAIALSVDQTGRNSDEVSRITREHPDESDIVKDGRVLGIAVSRAFGDGFWKWERELQVKIAQSYYNAGYLKKIPNDLLKTPPYLTAEPVITTTGIRPKSGDFLIMASDGFWDHVSNEQAVKLVRDWIEWQEDGAPEQPAKKSDAKVDRIDEEMFRFHEGITALRDDNVATHLVRNALGGSDEDFLCGILTLEFPRTRGLRDDITVEVIFFGDA